MSVKLLVVQGKAQGKSLQFPRGEYVFGRGAECHIRPNSEWVSRQHCILRVTGGVTSIRDLGSRNGTLVNGERVVDERQLEEGDHLQVGPLVFEVHYDRRPVGSPAAEALNSRDKDDTGFFCNETAELPPASPAALPGESPEHVPQPALPAQE